MSMRARSAIVILLGFVFLPSMCSSYAIAEDTIPATCDTLSYTVSIRDTTDFQVDLRFRATQSLQRLFLPENSPGGLREVYARFVEDIHVETTVGDEAEARRVGASTWEVDAEPGACVDVTYGVRRHADDPIRLVSNDLTVSDGYFVGATVLLGLESERTVPASLALDVPAEWSVWTTLPSKGPSTFQAASYEEIAQAPVLFGEGLATDIALAGGVLHVVALGAPPDSDLEGIKTRFREIAGCQERMFGFLAAPRILVGLRWREDLDVGGGVSRRDAVVMNVGRDWMSEPGRFASATFAHELFHTWNFGLFHPAKTRPWRPFGSTATRSLWLVEGLSDYYVLQTFVRLGRLDAQRALDWIGSEITSFETSPARAWASLEDGGPMADAQAPAGIDVHAGGFVVGFVLDARIRSDTGGRSSLDGVVRALAVQARTKHYDGYGSTNVESALRSAGGDGVVAAYRELVARPGPADYETLLRGTLYRVEIVEDPAEDAGHRWIVERLTPGEDSGTDVLGEGCSGDP